MQAQSDNSPESRANFWHSVWRNMSSALPGTFAEFSDVSGFSDAFLTAPKDGRRVLLIWDEFDSYSAYIPLWSSILFALKGLKALLPDQAPLLKVTLAFPATTLLFYLIDQRSSTSGCHLCWFLPSGKDPTGL